jgi:hypothetical protein
VYPIKTFLFIVLLSLVHSLLIAQDQSSDFQNLYQTEAYRLLPGESFTLDGRMNEPFWNNITPITNFTQQEPDEGSAPSEKTEIFIAYDSSNLYIAAKLHDSNPEQILAWQKRRNQSLATDDRFMFILDTFHDGRNAYFFETNPAGLRGDGLLTIGQGYNLNKAWDGIWDVRTSITDEGWIAEIRIPFRSMDFNPENSTWGINFQRTIRRHNEEIVWSGWRRHQGLFRPQNAGSISGLDGLDQGLGLEVTPYVTGTGSRSWQPEGNSIDDLSGDTGFDVTYSITPSIRSSLTINTDFAETEVDQRRVNLTRFPLRFPEQRNFFLEGSGIFSFAPASGIEPFFSRRIGLVGGEPIPIQAGARILGREGNTNIGFYQIRTGSTEDVNREDFTIARISQNFLSESNIGLIWTRRTTLQDETFNNRHTLGADMELSTSTFLGNKNLQFQAFFVWHNPHTPEEINDFWDRTSRGIRFYYPNFPFYAQLSYREFGSSFDPAVGFTSRNGFRRFQPTIGYVHYLSDNRLIRSWDVQTRFEYLTDLNFRPADVNLTITPFDIEFESGEEFEASIRRDFEWLPFDFDILRDGSVIIESGDYYSWIFNTGFSTASYRNLSGNVEYTYESFWTGTRNTYELSATIRPFPGINLSADWNRSDINLPQADFTTDLIRFRGNIDLTPDIAFTNIVQFDDISDVLGLYNRFRWTITPGSDLYLVYTHNWVRDASRFSFNPIETQGAIKLNYTHRF